MKRVLAALLLVVASAGIAVADEATARQNFDAGERAYNLGEFEKAVELFKQAYDQWAEPAFLFNVAQTYRQIGDCKQALFFYKRFLALKERDDKKPLRPQLKEEVEKRVTELEECVKRELAAKPPNQLDNGSGTSGTDTPPSGNGPATGTGPTTGTAQDGTEADEIDDETDDETDNGATASTPSVLSLRALVGAAKLSAGDLETALQFTTGIIGGYPLAISKELTVELGAVLGFTPVPYITDDGMQGTGSLLSILANAAPSYEVIPKLSVRADLGVGVMLFTGLDMEMNPFTDSGNSANGALTVVNVRTALSVDYAVTPNIVVTATPLAFAYSPAPAGFLEDIPSLTTLSFMAGVGYRR